MMEIMVWLVVFLYSSVVPNNYLLTVNVHADSNPMH